MSKREVINPEDHGWEFVGNKWIWNAGRNTGHIVDGDTEGQIATWHDPANAWTPESAVVVSGGNVGIGTDSPTNTLVVSDGSDGLEFRTSLTDDNRILSYNRGTSAYTKISLDAADYDFRINGGSPALTINATGDATLSNNLMVGSGSSSTGGPISSRGNGGSSVWNDGVTRTRLARFENDESEATRTTMTLWSDNNKGVVLQGGTNSGNLSLGTRTGATDNINMTIDGQTGDTSFSGTVSSNWMQARGGRIIRDGSQSDAGLVFSSEALYPAHSDGSLADDYMSLGGGNNRWKDGFFSGTITSQNTRSDLIIQDGAPVVDSLQIIRAFMKLRDAVDDPDSSVEQLRDKLKVAVIDIIDQFQDLVDTTPAPDTMPVPVED